MSFVIIFFKTFSLVFKFGERAYDKRKLQLSVEMLKDKIMDDSSLYSDGDVLLAFCRKIRKDFRTIQIQSNSKGQNMVTTSEIISANMS